MDYYISTIGETIKKQTRKPRKCKCDGEKPFMAVEVQAIVGAVKEETGGDYFGSIFKPV
jgi:hypothetical protein